MSAIKQAIEALELARKALDAIYNHNEASRAALIQHYGLHHTQLDAALAALREVQEDRERWQYLRTRLVQIEYRNDAGNEILVGVDGPDPDGKRAEVWDRTVDAAMKGKP
jgi:hypothetical protein